MPFTKGYKPWNNGIKYNKEQKARLNLSGLKLGWGHNKGKFHINIFKDVLLDKENSELLLLSGWYLSKYGYLVNKNKKTGKHTSLHQMVMGKTPKGMVIDHINRNKLDNRRENLRFVTPLQNFVNSKKRSDSHQLFKGIRLLPSGKYQARRGRNNFFGVFDNPKDAYKAYIDYIQNKFNITLCPIN